MIEAESSDLNYLRQVSARGADAPLLGARYTIWWGGLVTLAYLAHYLAARGVIGDGAAIFPLIWIGFGIVGGTGSWLLSRREDDLAGASSAGNRASRIAWFAAVLAILAYIAGAVARSISTGDYSAFDGSVPLVFAAYGIALAVSGWLAPAPAARFGSIAAFLTVALTSFLVGDDRLWLAAAAGASLSVFLPGLLLLRGESRRG